MRTGIAVIGANFGDEGKGALTDYIANKFAENCTVVRFNGGAQAGHTVVTPDGRRHVFSHFGAGSFSDCPSFLSRYFIVNPRMFWKELQELQQLNVSPEVTIDGRAFLTTPIDVFVNQTAERRRGASKHGSCGLGINETVTRCLRSNKFSTYVIDILDPAGLKFKLRTIAEEWLPQRLKELCFVIDPEVLDSFLAPEMIDKYLVDCEFLQSHSRIIPLTMQSTSIKFALSANTKYVLFEGAQGLMLDESRLDQFPHLTRSKTGLENVATLCQQFSVDALEVHYATRTYLTRHGAGPLRSECEWKFSDATNVPNDFQGTMRFAPLNIDDLNYSINLDLRRGHYLFQNMIASIAVTCADQHAIPDLSDLKLPLSYVGFGPARSQYERASRICNSNRILSGAII